MNCQHHPDYRPEKGDPSTIVTIATPSGLGFLEPRERPCGLCWMARAEWLEKRHDRCLRVIGKAVDQRDQLRELLVEAMVTACEDVRDEIDWTGSEGGWEEQTSKCYELHDWGWPPWFDSAARLIFQMRRSE